MDQYVGEGWWLEFYDRRKPFATTDGAAGLVPSEMARQNGAIDGTPYFVGPDGRADARINLFWRDPSVRAMATGTQRRYAFSLRVWLNFLNAIGVPWDRADATTLGDFKIWRMSAEAAERHVAASSFQLDLAAISRFYEWAAATCDGVRSPVRFRQVYHANHHELVEEREARPAGIRRADVKWLTPSAFRLWRDVGLRGFTTGGLPGESWSGTVEDRDVAFVEGLFGTGLRCGEWSSVLTVELPQAPDRRLYRSWLASACAKRGAGRPYWLPKRAAQAANFYLGEGGRAEAVAFAQSKNLYSRIPEILIVEEFRDGEVTVRSADQPRRMNVDALSPPKRMRLFRETDCGLEPLWLWLNNNGLPRPKAAWSKTFAVANGRVTRTLEKSDGSSPQLWARPHMLRHSFALRWFSVATFVAWERMSGLTVAEQRDFRNQLGDVWFLLSTLLGHRSVETTRNIYLEPFQSLQVDQLVAVMDSDDRAALERLIGVLSANEPRVLSVTGP
ncbi:site-specific integrase [Mycolicibacterium llatzerense]|uniref:site-specific integrase n=1 Tax=Mycolicibacterium llatzerense TaxID=280871 RepID=UPI0021B55659|nr:site-specific integrase [Mycolicibacterium llatzerense]MCT7367279.1 integrase [Mycolicibacterium llatzerense]